MTTVYCICVMLMACTILCRWLLFSSRRQQFITRRGRSSICATQRKNNGHAVGVILFPLTVETNYSALFHYVTVKVSPHPPKKMSVCQQALFCHCMLVFTPYFRKLGSSKKKYSDHTDVRCKKVTRFRWLLLLYCVLLPTPTFSIYS